MPLPPLILLAAIKSIALLIFAYEITKDGPEGDPVKKTLKKTQDYLNGIIDQIGEKGAEIRAEADAFVDRIKAEIKDQTGLEQAIVLAQRIYDFYEEIPDGAKSVIDRLFSVQSLVGDNLRRAAKTEGYRRINTRGDTFEDKTGYLNAVFSGLFLIGRSGEQLNSSERTRLIGVIQSIYKANRHSEDNLLYAWSLDPDSTKKPDLDRRLGVSLIVNQLEVEPKYIAFALGQTFDPPLLIYHDLLTDLQGRTWS